MDRSKLKKKDNPLCALALHKSTHRSATQVARFMFISLNLKKNAINISTPLMKNNCIHTTYECKFIYIFYI